MGGSKRREGEREGWRVERGRFEEGNERGRVGSGERWEGGSEQRRERATKSRREGGSNGARESNKGERGSKERRTVQWRYTEEDTGQ